VVRKPSHCSSHAASSTSFPAVADVTPNINVLNCLDSAPVCVGQWVGVGECLNSSDTVERNSL
jgi:hypothetical protein